MSDGEDEVLEQAGRKLTAGVMVAARVIDPLAGAVRQRVAERAARVEAETRRAQRELETQRRLMRAELAPVREDAWWQTAGVEDAAAAWRLANAWRGNDEIAATAAAVIEQRAPQQFAEQEFREAVEKVPDHSQAHTAPFAAAADEHDPDLAAAKAWLAESDPTKLRAWERSYDAADSVDSRRSDERSLIATWRAAVGDQSPSSLAQDRAAAARADERLHTANALNLLDAADTEPGSHDTDALLEAAHHEQDLAHDAGHDVAAIEQEISSDRARIDAVTMSVADKEPAAAAGRVVAAKGNAHPPAQAARSPRTAAKARKARTGQNRGREQARGR